jgi:hypothetical protein
MKEKILSQMEAKETGAAAKYPRISMNTSSIY